ncbi:hypothetical protein Tco_0852802 [Tanacetum coccineum]
MLAPKCATYNGRLTFANPKYLKTANLKNPDLYEIPFDTSDPANKFAPEREETMTLDNESRSKLNKDIVKPYDYTKQNSLYQLERTKEVRKTMWRKPFDLESSNARQEQCNSEVKKLIENCKGTSFNGQKQQRIDLNADALYNEKQENLRVCSSLVLHQMMSDHNSSDLAPQRQEMSVENVSSGLVPQGQKASDYDNSDPMPPRQNVVPTAEKTDSSQQGLEFLFSPFLEELLFHHHIAMMRTTGK